MEYADLHIHTDASDGLLSPSEVVDWAFKKRLRAIGITDHDTVSGIDIAIKSNSAPDKLEIVPGIELNTELDGKEIHMLGYYIDYNNPWFLDILKRMQKSRYSRAVTMIDKLNHLGVNINLKQVEEISKGSSIGRPHIARAMVDKEYVDSMACAFERYIGIGGPAYVERFKLTTEDAINMIKEVGGIPVLAHPGLIADRKAIVKVLNLGVKGIEVYHPKHDPDMVKYLFYMVKERKLLMTGGTDCHGMKQNGQPIMGSITIDYTKVLDLKRAADLAKK
ncbi:PHP domain-containing protein [Lutispora saccharofermentans]|uniref:PHP domain-containing protein n=1 Tax=Lutispora saccharofermentans TaxID=3024236 RepID=A0ABT1NF72_9FIRM|nr:PHP domain-containing protein [Lutispora saccharofermentans]MCQ1529895.1 PHP domain-containing protein [Lutispora saccharofermentans]